MKPPKGTAQEGAGGAEFPGDRPVALLHWIRALAAAGLLGGNVFARHRGLRHIELAVECRKRSGNRLLMVTLSRATSSDNPFMAAVSPARAR